MKKKLLSVMMALILLVSSGLPVRGEVIHYKRYKDFKYIKSDYKSINVRYYIGKKKKVSIPEKIKGLKVRYVYLIRAKSLKKIRLSRYVKDANLSKNRNLRRVTVDKRNKYLCVKNNMILNKKKTKLMSVLGGYETIKIPKCVKRLKNCSFYWSKVKKVIITKNVEVIEAGTFTEARKLHEIVFEGNRIPKIGDYDAIDSYLPEMKFYVKNEKLADDLLKKLEGKTTLATALIYVGNKLVRVKKIEYDYT